MRRYVLAGSVVCLVVAAYLLMAPSNRTVTEDEVLQALFENDPSLSGAQISLAECRVQIQRGGQIKEVSGRVETLLEVDARLFDWQTVQVVTLQQGVQALTVSRKALDASMLQQAQALVDALPPEIIADMPSDALVHNLATVLENRDAQMKFQVQAVTVTEDGTDKVIGLQSGPLAPAFAEYTAAVRALPAPRSFALVATYAPSDTGAQELVAGSVTFPAQLQFRVSDPENARALGEALYRYFAASCSTETG